jgi:periplasmic protein CpxP/Spy
MGGEEEIMLKRKLIWMAGLAIVLGLALSAAPAHAQAGPGPEAKGQGGPRGRGMMSPEDQLNRLAKDLNLTDDQKGQIKPILEDRHEKMQKLFSDDSLSQEDRRSKMREIFEASNKKIRDVLNDDQKKKFDEMQAKRRERMEKRSGSENN